MNDIHPIKEQGENLQAKLHYHEGIDFMNEMQTTMMRTVGTWCLAALGLALAVAAFITFFDSKVEIGNHLHPPIVRF
jgi:hypothetical protein